MKKITLTILLSNLVLLALSQSNPNDVSVFFRIEAAFSQVASEGDIVGYQVSDYPAAWLQANPPLQMEWHLATPAGGTISKLATFKFERQPDCRIKTIRGEVTVNGMTYVFHQTDFEYDLPNHQIIVTPYDVDPSTGLPEYYWRFRFTYDVDENIVKNERIWWDNNIGNWDTLSDTWDYTNWDACGNFGHVHAVEGGTIMQDYSYTRTYLSGGGCRVETENIISGNTTDTYTWAHDGNGHISMQTELITSPGGSSVQKDTLEYDSQSRRIVLKGDVLYSKYQYDWNADNSLNWLEYNSPGNEGDTLYRKILTYGMCSVVHAIEPEKSSNKIIVESPVQAGQSASIFGLRNNDEITWLLINTQGQVISSGKLEQNESVITIPTGIQLGVYFINFVSENRNSTSRILVY